MAPQASLFRAEDMPGICRVVCFTPRHDLTLPELSQVEVEAVTQTWIEQVHDLQARPFIRYVQVFENKGAIMGTSNPHPHSQIYGLGQVPNEVALEGEAQAEYRREHSVCLLCDYLAEERSLGERTVAGNEHFTAMVPYWAYWPFEVLLLSNRHVESLTEFRPAEVTSLADILRRVTARYDNLFQTSFPYSMGFHQAPSSAPLSPVGRGAGGEGPGVGAWHLHAHYYPPLLRSATVRKFMVGFELLCMPQRDLTPEEAAERLRAVSERHYRSPPEP